MFNFENAKAFMKQNGISASKLSQITGIGKSSISQYLSGKNEPSNNRVEAIASAIGCEADDLFTTASVTIKETAPATTNVNMTCHEAAALVHKNDFFIRKGLQDGVFPFGYAVKGRGNKWTYFISRMKFAEFTGIKA